MANTVQSKKRARLKPMRKAAIQRHATDGAQRLASLVEEASKKT